MTRFSPTSGTTSASVPIAATLTKPAASCSRSGRRHSACTSFSATPTPARFLSGYVQSCRFGLMTASAGGSVGPGSWWSVMIRSTPSSRARRAASAPRMPQSTETTSRDPVGVQPLERRRLQAVAVPQPLGDEVHDVAAEPSPARGAGSPSRSRRRRRSRRGPRSARAARSAARMRSTAAPCRPAAAGRAGDRATGCRNRGAASGSSRPRIASSRATTGLTPSARRAPRPRVVAGHALPQEGDHAGVPADAPPGARTLTRLRPCLAARAGVGPAVLSTRWGEVGARSAAGIAGSGALFIGEIRAEASHVPELLVALREAGVAVEALTSARARLSALVQERRRGVGSVCAPPTGSGTISSMMPRASRSRAVSFSASAASTLRLGRATESRRSPRAESRCRWRTPASARDRRSRCRARRRCRLRR